MGLRIRPRLSIVDEELVVLVTPDERDRLQIEHEKAMAEEDSE